MSERIRSFWSKIFGPKESARERRALEYIVHRIDEGSELGDIVEEEYVRRTVSQDKINDILSDPKIVEAAREKMQDTFESGELDPNRRSE